MKVEGWIKKKTMWKEIFRFEIKYHLRQNVFCLAAVIFFITGLLLMSTGAGITFSDVPGTLDRNAPIVVVKLLTFLSLLGLFAVTAFVSSAALRDFEHNTHMLFFSKPVNKFDYLTARFAGSMVISLLIMVAAAAGMLLGNFMPWQEAESAGSFTLGPYGYGFLFMVLPNLLVLGGLFFAIAIWSRRLLVAYICVVAFLGLQDVAETIALNFENNLVAGLIEPMGIAATKAATRYWTVSEYNSMLPALTGGLLHNRALWLTASLAVFIWSCARFTYARAAGRVSRRYALEAPCSRVAVLMHALEASGRRSFTTADTLLQLMHRTRIEVAAIMRSTPFIILLIMGLLIVVTSALLLGEHRGTPVYPVTRIMLDSVMMGMLLFLVITVVFYSGEIVWRERSLRLEEVYDALPVPDWVYLGSKSLTLFAVTGVFILAGTLSTIVIQVFQGYFRLELSLYMSGFLILTSFFMLFSVLGIFMQVVTANKFTGYMLTVAVFLVSTVGLRKAGLEHTLYRFPGSPSVQYSDMNGYGHLLAPFLWTKLYWALFGVMLMTVTAMLWRRGTELTRRTRLKAARARFRRKARFALFVSAAAFVATGAFIFYNTNILNEYRPARRLEAMQAEYEKKYRRYRDIVQPRITDVYADVDIFPIERRVKIRGRYRLENMTGQHVDSVHVNVPPDVKINRMDMGAGKLALADDDLGYYVYVLPRRLAPGESMYLSFDLAVEPRGFVNNDPNLNVIYNGTFFNNRHYFPSLGYNAGWELLDRKKRRKHGLPPAVRMAAVDSLEARRNSYISHDADWVNFETVVSTAPGQTAIAPGYLQREWEENGRHYFHYKMDAPILNFYSYLSAEYAVRRSRWKDIAIDVYYHEPHIYNIDRMIKAVKASLDYFTANFGPYQYRHVRIIEFPCYETFAQSFPNTIPFSEGAGFIFKLEDGEDIDHVFNITAHEVAHQWWAHQVIGANVQGATLMSEALAEYSALMVMEREYGPEMMRHMLKHELDGYLHGRGREVLEEKPIMLVEDQRYIHYNKGCMVMYALRDYIGEDRVNAALARYADDMAYQQPPYTNSIEFMSYLREVTPDSLVYTLEDMFETITIFSNRVKSATYRRLDDGTYLVSLELEARKFRADGQGVETEVGIDDWIDIGVFGKKTDGTDETVLFMKKRHITSSSTHLEVVVDEVPVRAGIDPYHRLIDRDSGDNVRKVSESGGPT